MQEVLATLAFPEIDYRPNDEGLRAAHGTCEWVLEHHLYQRWLDNNDPLLWIKGKPGSGKSTLLKYVLEQTRECRPRTGSKRDIVLSYFFYGQSIELQRSPAGLYRTLLYQLLEEFPSAASELVVAYEKKRSLFGQPGQNWSWDVQELKTFLLGSISSVLKSNPVTIFVDAFDEAGNVSSNDMVRDFLALATSVKDFKYKLFFTSRHYLIISAHIESVISTEAHNMIDVEVYVDCNLQELHEQFSVEIGSLRAILIKQASGMFLWVYFAIRTIRYLLIDGNSIRFIEEEIKGYPTELDGVYESVLRPKLGERDQELSLKLMQWLCFAYEPLTANQVRGALAVDETCQHRSIESILNSSGYNEDDKFLERRVRSLSRGLAEFQDLEPFRLLAWDPTEFRSDRKSVLVFIHQSALDYTSTRGLTMLSKHDPRVASHNLRAHLRISKSCSRILLLQDALASLKTFMQHQESSALGNRDLAPSSPETFSRSVYGKLYEFYLYASEHWCKHEHACSSLTQQQFQLDLLNYPGHPWDHFLWSFISRAGTNNPCGSRSLGTLLHLATYEGWNVLVEAILMRYNHDEIEFNWNQASRNPWELAVEEGRLEVVKILMQRLSLDPNGQRGLMKSRNEELPLLRVIQVDHVSRNYTQRIEIFKFLLLHPTTKVNLRNYPGLTPLIFITYHMTISINNRDSLLPFFKYLLSHEDIDPRRTSEGKVSPIMVAACRGCHQAMQLLTLELQSQEQKSGDRHHVKPQVYPVSKSRTANGKMLTGRSLAGIFLDDVGYVRDERRRMCAHSLERELKRHDVNPNGSVNPDCNNPMIFEAACKSFDAGFEVLEVLLDCPKVDPNYISNLQWGNPGHWTVLSKYIEFPKHTIVAVLLSSSRMDVSIRSMAGRILWKALVENANARVLQLFLDMPRGMTGISSETEKKIRELSSCQSSEETIYWNFLYGSKVFQIITEISHPETQEKDSEAPMREEQRRPHFERLAKSLWEESNNLTTVKVTEGGEATVGSWYDDSWDERIAFAYSSNVTGMILVDVDDPSSFSEELSDSASV